MIWGRKIIYNHRGGSRQIYLAGQYMISMIATGLVYIEPYYQSVTLSIIKDKSGH